MQTDLKPLILLQPGKIGFGDFAAFLKAHRTTVRHLAIQHLLDAGEGIELHNALLIMEIFAHPLELLLLDLERARILLDTVTGENLNIDNLADDARWDTQRGILDIGCLFTKDGTQQLLFGRQLRLAFWRDLAHQNVAILDLGADIDDPRLIEAPQIGLADIGNIRCNLFRTQLGVTRHAGQLFDMNRGEAILLDDALGDQD